MIVAPPDGPCVLALFAILVFLSSHAELGRAYPLRRGACQMYRKMAGCAARAFVMSTVCSAAFSSCVREWRYVHLDNPLPLCHPSILLAGERVRNVERG